MGLVLVWGSVDVVNRSGAMQIFFGSAVVGGTLRILSIFFHGVPSPMVLFVIGGELSASALWWWHRRILKQQEHKSN